MIYDCFTFFNELDLLEIRLNILDDVVDKFVLVEGNKTHTGADKEFVFEENKQRFEKFLEKIIYIKVDDFPNLDESESDQFGNKWLFENFQRNAIMRGLTDCKDDDVIIIADLDEIPKPEKVIEYSKIDGIKYFDMTLFCYYLNCLSLNERNNTLRMLSYKELLNGLDNAPLDEKFYWRVLERYRNTTNPNTVRCFEKGIFVKNGGWHFSYCGGIDAIIKKRQSIVEQQFNTEKNMKAEHILNAIQKGEDIYGRKELRYEMVMLDSSFPRYILENKEKYSNLIAPLRKYKNFVDITIENNPYTKALRQIKEKSYVLDVGCASGYIGEYLFNEKDCEIVGFDIGQEYIDYCNSLGCYKNLHLLNLDKLSDETDVYNGKFDYILMLDVIEHTRNPVEVVFKLKKLLKPSGKIIFSIPNISHGSIVISLLQNQFKYQDQGLLDYTHISFFTLENIINLFNETHMQITNLEYVYQPFHCGICPQTYKKAGRKLLKKLLKDPQHQAYQYVVTVENNPDPKNGPFIELNKLSKKELGEIAKTDFSLKQLAIKFLCCFAPSKKLRQKIRSWA